MSTFVMCMALLAGQMITMQSKPVVYVRANTPSIDVASGGKLVDLVNAPSVVHLPRFMPKPDAEGTEWSIEVKNLGPAAVTIAHQTLFSVNVSVGQTVYIYSNGVGYYLRNK